VTEHISIEDLSALIDGELQDARAERVEQHLSGCADCRADFEALRWAATYGRALPTVALPEGAAIALSPDAAARARRGAVTDDWRAWAALAAVVVVSLAALWRFGPTAGERPAMVADRGALGGDRAQPRAFGAEESAAPAAVMDIGPAPTADATVAGYPMPFSTARGSDLSERGGVPPPEVGTLAGPPPAFGAAGTGEGGPVARGSPASTAAAGIVADARGSVAAPAAAVAADDSAVDGVTAPSRSADVGREEAAPGDATSEAPSGVADATSLPSEPGGDAIADGAADAAGSRMAGPSGTALLAILAVAAALLAMSAVIFVRAASR
jgi:hypothetical protein